MSVSRKDVVTLTAAERAQLTAFTRKGVASARELGRARVLLLADAGTGDPAIAAAVGCCIETVARIRRRAVQAGVAAALPDRPRPGATPLLTDEATATLIALAGTDAPAGRTTWTMQLLADRLVVLGLVDAISADTVRRTLKKTCSSPGSGRSGALRP